MRLTHGSQRGHTEVWGLFRDGSLHRYLLLSQRIALSAAHTCFLGELPCECGGTPTIPWPLLCCPWPRSFSAASASAGLCRGLGPPKEGPHSGTHSRVAVPRTVVLFLLLFLLCLTTLTTVHCRLQNGRDFLKISVDNDILSILVLSAHPDILPSAVDSKRMFTITLPRTTLKL